NGRRALEADLLRGRPGLQHAERAPCPDGGRSEDVGESRPGREDHAAMNGRKDAAGPRGDLPGPGRGSRTTRAAKAARTAIGQGRDAVRGLTVPATPFPSRARLWSRLLAAHSTHQRGNARLLFQVVQDLERLVDFRIRQRPGSAIAELHVHAFGRDADYRPFEIAALPLREHRAVLELDAHLVVGLDP